METENKNKKFLGPFYCLMASLVWGSSFVAQSVGGAMGTFTFNVARTVVGFFTLLPFAIIFVRKDLKKSGEKAKPVIKKTVIASLCCGLCYCIAENLQQYAFNFIESGKIGFITAFYMIFVPIFSIIMRKKVGLNAWIGVAFGIAGLYFLSIKPGSFTFGKGEIITLGCALFFTFHILTIDRFAGEVNGIALSCGQFLVAFILTLPFMLAFEEPTTAQIKAGLIPILYAGCCSCGIGYTCQILGQKYSSPTAASILMSFESVFSVIFGFLILHETLDSRAIIGCVLMFVGIILTQIKG